MLRSLADQPDGPPDGSIPNWRTRTPARNRRLNGSAMAVDRQVRSARGTSLCRTDDRMLEL